MIFTKTNVAQLKQIVREGRALVARIEAQGKRKPNEKIQTARVDKVPR